jgi:hypothetical protein
MIVFFDNFAKAFSWEVKERSTYLNIYKKGGQSKWAPKFTQGRCVPANGGLEFASL